MGTIIRFPKQWQDGDRWQDGGIDYSGLELFVESCWKFLDTLPIETRSAAREEFGRIIESLLQFMNAYEGARRSD